MTDAEINKAVAEIAGWRMVRLPDTPNEDHRFARGRHPNVPDDEYEDEGVFALDCCPDYANSLDAIVPVVREWMQKEVPFSFHSASIEYDAGDDAKSRECFRASIMGWTHYTKENPARALCLAFLHAVGTAARDSA